MLLCVIEYQPFLCTSRMSPIRVHVEDIVGSRDSRLIAEEIDKLPSSYKKALGYNDTMSFAAWYLPCLPKVLSGGAGLDL